MNAQKPERGQPPKDGKPTSAKQHEENVLEKSLEDTFPASDPPATTSPGGSVGWDTSTDEKKKD